MDDKQTHAACTGSSAFARALGAPTCHDVQMRNWQSLTDIDFEELAADLFAAEFGHPVERFGRGADGGVDLRWNTDGGGKSIAQCKHYAGSSFAQLLASAKKEKAKVDKLAPAKYLFATSQMLTLAQKTQLRSALGGWLKVPEDVLSGSDLDQMLDRQEKVERKHVKLWLSTGTELFWATHSDLLNRSEALRQRIDRTIRQYVGAKSFEQASVILNREKVCLIAGQPGVGKTVLAHMLLADHMTRGFEIVDVSNDINEAWTALDVDRPQVFVYDDFLGQLSFSERLGKNEDARLADFIDRIRELSSKRLILTTREYILRDASRVYMRMDSVNRHGKYILEIGDYTRDDKARILYNHVWVSKVDRKALLGLANGGWKRIVDHPNYSPRLIEYGVRSSSSQGSQKSWIDSFVSALDDPATLWKQTFDEHLSEAERLLLYVLASFGAAVEVEALQLAHKRLCEELAVPWSPTACRKALETMEGTFLEFGKDHRGVTVAFDNPSIVDFVLNELRREPTLQASLFQAATHFEQLERLWSRSSAAVTVLDQSSSSRVRAKVLNDSEHRAFAKAVMRTYTAAPLQPRTNYEDSAVQSREERLAFICSLPIMWRPEAKWIARAAEKLTKRWSKGVGNRSRAFDLIFGSSSLRTLFPKRAEDVLASWLKEDLEGTSDWVVLGKLLDLDGGYPYDAAFADDFRLHVAAEIERWSPAPPSLEELIDLSEAFGVSDLYADLELLREQEWARDENAADDARDWQATAASQQNDESDGAIERYFDHF